MAIDKDVLDHLLDGRDPQELHGIDVSPDLISTIAGAVLEAAAAGWTTA